MNFVPINGIEGMSATIIFFFLNTLYYSIDNYFMMDKIDMVLLINVSSVRSFTNLIQLLTTQGIMDQH